MIAVSVFLVGILEYVSPIAGTLSAPSAAILSSRPISSLKNSQNVAIIGGRPVAIEDYPYQVYIARWGHFCGGAIISANFVITAAHCVSNHPIQSFTIRAGSSNRLKGGPTHSIAEIIIHENFNSYLENDIALMKVNEPFIFDESRQPVGLFNQTKPIQPGILANMSGWGVSEDNRSSELRAIQVPIVDQEICNIVYSEIGGLGEARICAGYYNQEGKGPCFNDDGGPLVVEGRLVAIMSFVYFNCLPPNYPAIYSDIYYFRKWIERHAGF
ncbi:hypothetical protein QAD02_023494 [Eretmocerus hayati]|uniref:Uncharacterized protein n=1 Tax=Eretmocerus hayati TaxID=131215 RepID=A0ACC2PVT4_9HYME|nr:hypothetical protein QAD02_023494 [Eretmocerus hayati]